MIAEKLEYTKESIDEIYRALIEKGADVNMRNTPLMLIADAIRELALDEIPRFETVLKPLEIIETSVGIHYDLPLADADVFKDYVKFDTKLPQAETVLKLFETFEARILGTRYNVIGHDSNGFDDFAEIILERKDD